MKMIVLYFVSVSALAAQAKFVGHCYRNGSDFTPRTIKILEVNPTEYKYMLFNQKEWFGPFLNFKDSVEVNYTKEVSCK